MFAYSLYVVTKRTGLPAWPRPRSLVVQTLLAIPLVVIAIPAVGVTTFAVNRLLGDAARGRTPFDAMVYSTNPIPWIAFFILGVVVAPLAEEPFHRGMLFNALRQRMHWVVAAVLMSVVFALFHPYGLADRAEFLFWVYSWPGFTSGERPWSLRWRSTLW